MWCETLNWFRRNDRAKSLIRIGWSDKTKNSWTDSNGFWHIGAKRMLVYSTTRYSRQSLTSEKKKTGKMKCFSILQNFFLCFLPVFSDVTADFYFCCCRFASLHFFFGYFQWLCALLFQSILIVLISMVTKQKPNDTEERRRKKVSD